MGKALVPRLRFPEFKDAGEWERTTLKYLFSKRQEVGFTTLPLLSLMDKEGIILQEESNRRDNSNADKSKYLRVIPGDIAYNTMRMWEGRSAYVGIEGLISPAYTVCVPIDQISGMFFSCYFKTEQLIQEFRRYSQGLVSDTLNLKFEAFAEIEVDYPTKAEQQKIADCLSSLDDLITAENNKLKALKTHKKGLMQQLFPREGEKAPRLRFPEFKDDWDNFSLSQLSDRITMKVGETKLTTLSITAGFGFVSQIEKFGRDISGAQYKNYIHLKQGQFAYNKGNSKTFPQGCIYQLDELQEAAVPNAFISFSFKEDFVPEFFKGYFDNNYHGQQLAKFITSGARSDGLLNISPDDFFSMKLPSPKQKAEQQKIADCLSSLDDLISAQTKKIETLKIHKKGLMQQLFPAMEEAWS